MPKDKYAVVKSKSHHFNPQPHFKIIKNKSEVICEMTTTLTMEGETERYFRFMAKQLEEFY